MSVDPTLAEQVVLAETRRRRLERLQPRELAFELFVVAMFVLGIVGLWRLRAPVVGSWREVVLCVAVTAVAARVRFQTTFGDALSTQIGFVALAFVVPAALLPLAMLVSFGLSELPVMVRGTRSWSKAVQWPSNCAFAFGPALVLALAGNPWHLGWPVLLVALVAQFTADFAVSVAYHLVVRHASVRSQLGEVWWVWVIDSALSVIGLVIAGEMRQTSLAILAAVPLLGLFAMFARERSGRLEKLLELGETYRGTALLLGDVVEADDTYTGMHSQGVVELALAVGERLGLDAERRRNLEFAALLHDVGKIAIPKEILNKPGSLDDAEWTLMRTHAEEGQRMLTRVGGFMTEVGAIVRSHHERWDGHGYPDGLLGEATPLESRIITACDSWSAMRTDRPYRKALALERAIEEIVGGNGSQFDPRVGAALLEIVGASPAPLGGEPLPAVVEPASLASASASAEVSAALA